MIKPLAFDSFGVRSMATYVETEDVKITIDPGVSLAPRRFGLPTHPLELARQKECAKAVQSHAEASDILIVTHYHYDHHDLGGLIPTSIYTGKKVFVKHPRENINYSQRAERAPRFLQAIRGLPKTLDYADGVHKVFGRTSLRFSKAVAHGTDTQLGYVVEVSIGVGGEKLVYTSDVEGPSLPEQARFILDEKPSFLIVDGPLTYMLGYRYSQASLETSMENLAKIVEKTPVKTILLEHHFMRDLNYRKLASPLCEAAERRGVQVLTAAEFLGRKVEMLEASRLELYKSGGSRTTSASKTSNLGERKNLASRP
nr:MBL fold metallo-hydrolase [Candidatus Hecatella orcuttiae]